MAAAPLSASSGPVDAAPAYRVEYVEPGSDQLRHTPLVQWPDPQRAGLRQMFAVEYKTVIHFDNELRPCDLPARVSSEANPRVAPPRRLTPRNITMPIPEDLGK